MNSDDEKLDVLNKQIQSIIIRQFIEDNVPSFKNKSTYIVYDNKEIEEYNKDIFVLKRKNKYFETYFISEPVEFY